MDKIGFAVDNLGPSQLNHELIRAINARMDAQPQELLVFYSNLTRPCISLSAASMQMTEAYGFDGTLVATSFVTAQKILACPAAKRRIYYVYDLETENRPDFSTLSSVYHNPRLEFFTRAADYNQVLQTLFNRNAPVLSIEQLIHVL